MTVQPDPSFDPGKLRASDADREAVAKVLQTAMSEGRLSPSELQERLDLVYASKTLSELEPVTWDLPGHTALVPPAPPVPPVPNLTKRVTATPETGHALAKVGGTPTSSAAIGIMSGTTRKGPWVVPAQFTALTIMGGVEIDLTQATFAERVVTITAVALMGGIEIVVPDDITVMVNGAGVMGAFEDSAHVQGVPGGPVVKINGVAIMGAVDVRRPKKRRDELEK